MSEKEYKIKKHYKKVKEIVCTHETDTLGCQLLEYYDAAEYYDIKNLFEVHFDKPDMADADRLGGIGAVYEDIGGCILIDFKPKGVPEEQILICSSEFKEKIDKSKLDKLVDKITYP